jgi:hypothetical protein
MTIAILACAIMTLGSLVYLFSLPQHLYTGPQKTRLAYLRERKEVI